MLRSFAARRCIPQVLSAYRTPTSFRYAPGGSLSQYRHFRFGGAGRDGGRGNRTHEGLEDAGVARDQASEALTTTIRTIQEQIRTLSQRLDKKDIEIRKKDIEIRTLKIEIRKKDTEIRTLKQRLDKKDIEIRTLKQRLDEKDIEIRTLKQRLDEKDIEIHNLNESLDKKDIEIHNLNVRIKITMDTTVLPLHKAVLLKQIVKELKIYNGRMLKNTKHPINLSEILRMNLTSFAVVGLTSQQQMEWVCNEWEGLIAARNQAAHSVTAESTWVSFQYISDKRELEIYGLLFAKFFGWRMEDYQNATGEQRGKQLQNYPEAALYDEEC